MDENYLSTINALSRIKSDSLLGKSSSGQSKPANSNFQQLLLEMMLMSGLGDSTSDSSPDNALSRGSSNSMMDPLMSALIDQVLMKQVSAVQSSPADPTQTVTTLASSFSIPAGTTLKTGNTNPLIPTSTNPGNSPEGRPVGGVLTQGYHSTHHALDFGVPTGTPVHATMGGKVVYAGWNTQGYGNLVIVENGPYETYFAHLSKIPVSLGQLVQAGSVVGISGSTGNSTGPHVHYEVRRNGQAIDPTSFTLKNETVG
ncbi:MAG TPA: M23 family metallopeptidase [Anaerolineaceae bacterium]|nr:M23 family metallopeptidase [Anaerolineaceae bacterium]